MPFFDALKVYIRLIDQPPKGAEAFTETVYKRLLGCSFMFTPVSSKEMLASNTGTQVTPAGASPS